ncbi:hypothetical protein RS030_3447 [Cryptosporidium xiaoi]|uniref:Uncharacterized protein n=1 Tax=Cryptosporidium xiaoi TaxID=659607 RepID=A0AAV9XV41_9CRYT
MSGTTRANSLFTLPSVSHYTRTNSLTTVIDHMELSNNAEMKEGKKEKTLGTNSITESETILKRNRNFNAHELEVQLMMKDKMIEELLEENGKLIENMNKLEQDKLDEQNRIQQGTEMVIQQIVEDNEWYKSQFLEMKNELEKAITQTRSKGREISTMEKRCKALIEEKETIQNFLDELTYQYDKRVEQLKNYKNNIINMVKLTNKFIGMNNNYFKGSDYCSINELVHKIREIISGDNNLNNIEHLITQIQFNAKKFEVEINEIYENIQKGLSTKDLSTPINNDNCCESNDKMGNYSFGQNQIGNKFDSEIINKSNDLKVNQKVTNKGYENISLKNKYNKVIDELENSKNEIDKLKYEIKRKSQIIQELKALNRENSDILDNINNQKENQQIKLLLNKINILNHEKRELIQKIAKFNLENPIITEQKSNYESNRSQTEDSNVEKVDDILENNGFNNTSSDNDCKFTEDTANTKKKDITIENDKFRLENFEETKEDKAYSSISKIVNKYIKYPVDYVEKKQTIQRNSVQRNRYF